MPLNVRPLSNTIKQGVPLPDTNHFRHLRNAVVVMSVTMSRCTTMGDATGKQAQPYFVGSRSTRVPDV